MGRGGSQFSDRNTNYSFIFRMGCKLRKPSRKMNLEVFVPDFGIWAQGSDIQISGLELMFGIENEGALVAPAPIIRTL